MLVLSSPSGAGKTTLSRRLLASDTEITLSVSVTTRSPRPGEQDGVDYLFIAEDRFQQMRADDELLESAEVFGHYYGTPRLPVEQALENGRDVLFDIDWQGASQLAEKMREDLVRIFILPPSAGALEERLKARAQDPADVVAKRMAGASEEISHWEGYEYVLINDDVDRSAHAVSSILHAERLKRQRRTGLFDFVKTLQSEL